MANQKPLPREKLMELENEINRCHPLLQTKEFEEVLKIIDNVIPTLQTEFKKFEWSVPIDAYAYASQLAPDGQKFILETKGVTKLDDLKGKTIPHPYFMLIQNMYHVALTNKSAAYGALEQREEAIEEIKNAIAIKRGDPENWTNLGVLYIDSGEPRAAATCFRKAIRYKPEEERFWSNIGKYYEMRNRKDEYAIVEKTMNLLGKSNQEVLYNFIDLCLIGGDIKNADEVVTQLRQSQQDNPDVLLRSARIKALQNNHDGAAEILKRALKKNKNRADIHGELGRVLTILGKYKDASKALEKSLKIDPEPQYKYLYQMIKKKIDSTGHINMISAIGERQFRIHMGMKIPLGMTLHELLYNISKQGLGDNTNPYGFETTFVQIFDKEGGSLKFAADHISFPAPTGISGREPGEFSVRYSETFSEINYAETGYRPQDSLITIPLQYNAVHITNADVTLPDNIMMPMIPTLVQFHDIGFAEKKKELFG